MAGSITDGDIFESDWDDWLPSQASSEDKRCNLSWKQPWEKIEIKVCLPNGESIAQTDCTRYVSPLKIQFLKCHHLEVLQRIIQDIPTIKLKSLIFKEQLFEITLKSKSFANESMDIVTAFMTPCDDVIIRPIPRLKFTSKLVESVFRNHIVQEKTDVFRDESIIFIVGFQTMKGCIDDGIVQINRLTVTKTVIFKEKWQTIALNKFGIITDLIQQNDDVSVVLQDQTGRVCIQGSKEDVAKAADQLQQMLDSVSVEYISFDPLVLKLLLFKEALEYFNETLTINKIEIEWIVDDEKLCAFGKRNVNSDEIKSVLYTNFVSVGFGDASADCESFCRSQYFDTITTTYMNKMLVCERTTQCIYLAATKNIVQGLLYQEKVHNAKTTKTATEQVITTEKILDQETTDKIQLEAQLDNEIKENTKKAEDIKRSVQERQRLEKQVEGLQMKLKAAESTNNTTEKILDQIKTDKIQLEAQLNNGIKENTKKTEDIKRSVQDRQRLEKQVEGLQMKLKAAESTNKTTEKILDQLTTDKIQLEAQLKNEFKENTKKTEDIKRSVQERQRLEKQVKGLQMKLKAAESTNITTEKILDQLTTDKIQLEAQLNNEIKENTKKTEDIKRCVQERQRLEKQVKELQLKLKDAEGTYNSTQKILYQLTTDKSQFEAQLENEIQKNTKKTEDIKRSVQERQRLEKQVDKLQLKLGNSCGICMDDIKKPKRLRCGHVFCTDCIQLCFKHKPMCPQCGAIHGILKGDQPEGRMSNRTKKYSLPGYKGTDTIEIEYMIYSGQQGEKHPAPGEPFSSITRVAYLPDNRDGRLIARLLKVAFDRRLIFTIGTSTTTGKTGVVIWKDIHHKTNPHPNTQFGYPDETYFKRVLEELAAKGVTEKDLKD